MVSVDACGSELTVRSTISGLFPLHKKAEQGADGSDSKCSEEDPATGVLS